MTTVAHALLEGLRDAGTTHLFGVPGGGSSLELIEAASRHGLRFVLCHQETAACIMAAVTGELTGRPGAAIAGLGPGAASAVNGMAYALLDRAPMILLTDRHPEEHTAFATHQLIDQRALFTQVAKASLLVTTHDVSDQILGATTLALAEPRGPVHIDLPADIAARPAGGRRHARQAETRPALRDDVLGLDEAVRLIGSAHRPVLLAGLECRTESDASAVRALARRLGAPVLTTYKAKGVVADDDVLHLGIFTGGILEDAVIGSADLIVTIGLDAIELIPRRWPYPSPVVRLGRTACTRGYYHPTVEIVGAIDRSLVNISDRLHASRASSWSASVLHTLKRTQTERVARPGDGLAPHRVVQIARDLTPPGTIVTVDAGAHMFAATTFWTARDPGSFLISNGLATMGFALPAAIAAQLARPDRRVLCLTGDGGLMMVAGELETVHRLGLPLVIVVFNDLTLSLIRLKQEQKGYADDGTRYVGPDFISLAKSFALQAWPAASEPELKDALGHALSTHGPALIDARIDASAYRSMVEEIRGGVTVTTPAQ